MTTVGIIIDDITRCAGTERAVINLANMLSKSNDYYVYVFSNFSNENQNLYYDCEKKINIIHLGYKKENINNKVDQISFYYYLVKKIKGLILLYNIDTILGTGTMINSIISFLPRKVKKIACEHMSYHSCPAFSKTLRRFCYPTLDHIVLLTYSDLEKYKFIPKSKKLVIPNSLSFISNKKTDLNNKRIIAVGRLTKQKGFDYLIKAAVLIKKDLPDWHIDIYGSGEDKTKLEQQISTLNLNDYVTIKQPTKNIQQELLNSSIYLMSSRWEGLPMILIEAKSCGLPCVSFDCPEGPADIIKNNEDGFLVEMGNVDLLAKSVVLLAKDKKLLENFSLNSYNNSLEFSIENIYPKWKMIL